MKEIIIVILVILLLGVGIIGINRVFGWVENVFIRIFSSLPLRDSSVKLVV